MNRVKLSVFIVFITSIVSLGLLQAESDVSKGKAVFKKCGLCHHTDVDKKKMGPSMKGLFKKDKMENGKEPTEENVIATINEGGQGMPAYKKSLSKEDMEHLIAYLKTL